MPVTSLGHDVTAVAAEASSKGKLVSSTDSYEVAQKNPGSGSTLDLRFYLRSGQTVAIIFAVSLAVLAIAVVVAVFAMIKSCRQQRGGVARSNDRSRITPGRPQSM